MVPEGHTARRLLPTSLLQPSPRPLPQEVPSRWGLGVLWRFLFFWGFFVFLFFFGVFLFISAVELFICLGFLFVSAVEWFVCLFGVGGLRGLFGVFLWNGKLHVFVEGLYLGVLAFLFIVGDFW